METSQAQTKTAGRGRPKRNDAYNWVAFFNAYLNTLTFQERSVFIAKIMVALEISHTELKRFYTLNSQHTRPNRLAINAIAERDIYTNAQEG